MNKKSFNDIEQIIKNAADANQPAFNEQAWQKMEALLDKQDDKPKPFLWLKWLIPAMLVTLPGGYWLLIRQSANERTITSQAQSSTTKTDNKKAVTIPIDSEKRFKNILVEETDQVKKMEIIDQQNKTAKPILNQAKTKQFIPVSTNSINKQAANNVQENENALASIKAKTFLSLKPSEPENDDEEELVTKEKNELNKVAQNKEEMISLEKTVVRNLSQNIVHEPAVNNADSVIKKVNNITKNKTSKFYFLATAGIEKNGVKLFSSGKSTVEMGVGIGYQLVRRISIQTGFYSTSKKYKAGPGDYKTKPGSYWNIVDITRVDADCKVYEIPLLIRFDIKNNKKTTYFSSAGLSSYLMKKEDYHYYYYRNGAAYDAAVSYSGNNHLFSVIKLAVGAEKKLSDNFSINAAPGLALPLSGIGDGAVKLYSFDFNVGIKFIPSTKKIILKQP